MGWSKIDNNKIKNFFLKNLNQNAPLKELWQYKFEKKCSGRNIQLKLYENKKNYMLLLSDERLLYLVLVDLGW